MPAISCSTDDYLCGSIIPKFDWQTDKPETRAWGNLFFDFIPHTIQLLINSVDGLEAPGLATVSAIFRPQIMKLWVVKRGTYSRSVSTGIRRGTCPNPRFEQSTVWPEHVHILGQRLSPPPLLLLPTWMPTPPLPRLLYPMIPLPLTIPVLPLPALKPRPLTLLPPPVSKPITSGTNTNIAIRENRDKLDILLPPSADTDDALMGSAFCRVIAT